LAAAHPTGDSPTTPLDQDPAWAPPGLAQAAPRDPRQPQHGHGSKLIWNIPATGAITNWVPLITFAFLYGLSMDYEVFILVRMREAHDRGGSTDIKVAATALGAGILLHATVTGTRPIRARTQPPGPATRPR
jgi:hypothetical protein